VHVALAMFEVSNRLTHCLEIYVVFLSVLKLRIMFTKLRHLLSGLGA
jgi:hypothetical protein